MARRRTCQLALILLALFLVGTVVVLSTVSFYLKIDLEAYLSKDELLRDQNSNHSERIPKILHQTWKTETLPDKWVSISQECRDLMPDYDYMLWTDQSSREFINEHYPWFMSTFDAYQYPIQRADAIRYFVLHHYGGIYLDLDIGCIKPLDPLLHYPVILPKTIPVGVSNDLMFAEPRHPFLQQTIHNLVTFDHNWVLNYPTVMFSTGPMFLSAQYGLYNSAHLNEVRILPKSLYGKNAKPEDVPDSFFTHYYGSSWHSDDAGFITFLGKWGKVLMWAGVFVLAAGVSRLVYIKRSKVRSVSARRRRLIGRYDIILPRVFQRSESQSDVRSIFLSALSSTVNSTSPSSCSSPVSTRPPSPIITTPAMPLLYDSDVPLSPESDETEVIPPSGTLSRFSASRVFHSAQEWVKSSFGSNQGPRRRPNGRRRRSTLFFLPAIFTPSSRPAIRIHEQEDVDLPFIHTTPAVSQEDWSAFSGASHTKPNSGLTRSKSPRRQIDSLTSNPPPPPYESNAEQNSRISWNRNSQWSQWEGEELP